MPPIPKTEDEIEFEKNIILKSALNIIARSGCSHLTMRELAKECNSSSTKIYYYFKNKEHILFQLEEYGFIKLINNISKAIENCNSPEEEFTIMLKTIYHFGIKEADFFNLMFGLNSPIFLDYFEDSDLKDVASSEKNISINFLNLLVKITVNYGLSLNVKVDNLDVVAIFTQLTGNIHLTNAKIYKEINYNSEDVFDRILYSTKIALKHKNS